MNCSCKDSSRRRHCKEFLVTMSNAALPEVTNREVLRQLPQSCKFRIIVQQQQLIAAATSDRAIDADVNRLKASQNLDTRTLPSRRQQTCSSPKSENARIVREHGYGCSPNARCSKLVIRENAQGFDRVDRYEVLRPQVCPECGSQAFGEQPVSVRAASGAG